MRLSREAGSCRKRTGRPAGQPLSKTWATCSPRIAKSMPMVRIIISKVPLRLEPAPPAQSGMSFVAARFGEDQTPQSCYTCPSARPDRADSITVTRRSTDLSGSSDPNRPGSCRHHRPGSRHAGNRVRSAITSSKPCTASSSPWHQPRRRYRYLGFPRARRSSVTMPGVRRSRRGSTILFIRAAANSFWSCSDAGSPE